MLPSGVGVSQYLLYIRKQIFVYRAIEKAEACCKSAFLRRVDRNPSDKWSRDKADVEIAAKAATYRFEEDYYPDWWLSCLFLGRPAGNHCRDCFMSGKAAEMSVNRLQDIRDMAPKHTRRAIDCNSPTPSNASYETPTGKRQRFEIVHTYSTPSRGIAMPSSRAPLIASLKDRLQTLKEMGYDRNDAQYLSLLRELLQEQEADTMELRARITEPATEVNNNTG